MIDKLMRCEVMVDGEVVMVRDGFVNGEGERYIRCSDGSAARVGYRHDDWGDLWWLDVFNDGHQVGITVTTPNALASVGFEACEGAGMIYELLFFASALLRWKWWKHAVIIWREGELRLCDRKWLEGRVVFDIIAVDGVRFDEAGEEDGLEGDICDC